MLVFIVTAFITPIGCDDGDSGGDNYQDPCEGVYGDAFDNCMDQACSNCSGPIDCLICMDNARPGCNEAASQALARCRNKPPSTPTNLVANAISSFQIDLTWNASSDDNYVAGYKIYRNGAFLIRSSDTSFSDTNLNPETDYCYAVRAFDEFEESSGLSQPSCATTLPYSLPSPPTNLDANTVGRFQIDLTWDASVNDYNVTEYKIYRDGTYLKSATGTSASDTGLIPGTDYCYTVSAYDFRAIESAQSNQACATTLPDFPPTAPANLVANAVSFFQIDLSWDASIDDYGITEYKIYRDGIYLKSIAGTSVSDTSLIPGTEYCYTISAYDDVGNESAMSNPACASTQPDLTPPTVPTGFVAIAVSSSQVDLQWNPSSDNINVAGYNIYRDGINLKSVTEVTASDTGLDLDNGVRYCYMVTAYDAAGNESIPSNQICAMRWLSILSERHCDPRSVAIDSADNMHICYFDYGIISDDSDNAVKYTTNASGAWVTENLYTITHTTTASLSLDSADNVHIIHSGRLYTTNASGAWVTDNLGIFVYTAKTAIDSADNMHILYDYDDSLKYATNASGTWVIDTIDQIGHLDSRSIEIDSADNVHISYCNSIFNPNDSTKSWYLKYATNASGTWVIDTIESQINQRYSPSIAIDTADNVYICYYSNNSLKYGTNASGAWVLETIDNRSPSGCITSMAIDSADNVHISYIYDCRDYLARFEHKYATNESGSWKIYFIHHNEFINALYIAVDSADKVHLVYNQFNYLFYKTPR